MKYLSVGIMRKFIKQNLAVYLGCDNFLGFSNLAWKPFEVTPKPCFSGFYNHKDLRFNVGIFYLDEQRTVLIYGVGSKIKNFGIGIYGEFISDGSEMLVYQMDIFF